MLPIESTVSSAKDTQNMGQLLGGLGSGPPTWEGRTVRTGDPIKALTPGVESESQAPPASAHSGPPVGRQLGQACFFGGGGGGGGGESSSHRTDAPPRHQEPRGKWPATSPGPEQQH